MKPIFFLALLAVFAVSRVSAAEVTVAPPTGDIDPAFLAELEDSIGAVVKAEALPARGSAKLRASVNEQEDGVALEVTLSPVDGSGEIREARVASRASALAQARAMARTVIRAFAVRISAAPRDEGPMAPQDSTPVPGSPIDEARTAARPGIALGLGLDVAGFLGVIVSYAVFVAHDYHEDGALVGACVSGGVVVLGSFISTSAYTVRHAEYVKAGLHPRPYKATLGWMFSIATSVLYGVSVNTWADYMEREANPQKSLDEAFSKAFGVAAGMFLSGVSLTFEALNLWVIRSLWRREFKRSEKSPAVSIFVAPFVTSSSFRQTTRATGLAAVVLF